MSALFEDGRKNREQNDWSENIWLQFWLHKKKLFRSDDSLISESLCAVLSSAKTTRQTNEIKYWSQNEKKKEKRNKLKTEIKVHLELNWSLQGIRKFHAGFYLCQKTEKGPWKKAKKGKHCFYWFLEHFIVGLFLCFFMVPCSRVRAYSHEMKINYGNNEFSLFLVNNYRHENRKLWLKFTILMDWIKTNHKQRKS